MAFRSMPLRAAALMAALLLGPVGSAQDRVTARWELDPPAPYVGQTFDLRLVIDLDGAWSDRSLVQLFPRELELPLQLDALAAPTPGLSLEPVTAAAGPSLVVDGVVIRAAEDVRSGDRRRVVVARPARLEGAAPITLPAPMVRFVAASGFRDDLVQGQVPVDPAEGSALGEPLELRARALPEKGRPVEFAGAVGAFDLEAEISPRAFAVGDEVELHVEVTGVGFLPEAAAPRLVDAAPDFETLGRPNRTGREFIFRLRATRAGVERAPGARLATFDPSIDDGVWLMAVAEGPAVAVRAASAPSDPSPAGSQGTDAPEGGTPTAESTPPLPWTILTMGAVALLALVSAVRRIQYRAAVRAEARAGSES